MYDRFTERARTVVELAREEAGRMGDAFVGTEHLLLGLIRGGGGVAARVLKDLGVNFAEVRLGVEGQVVGGGNAFSLEAVPFTSGTKRVLELSVAEAKILGHDYIGTEHLLLGLVRERQGVAADILGNVGVNLEKTRLATSIVLNSWTSQMKK